MDDLVTLKFGGTNIAQKTNSYSVLNVTTSKNAPLLDCAFKTRNYQIGQYKDYYFHKYELVIPIADFEQKVSYGFEGGQQYEFYVPAFDQPYNLAFTSCNGLSSNVSPEAVKNNGITPLWNDINRMHANIQYHGQLGGGDQIYCDAVFSLDCLKQWLSVKDKIQKKKDPFTASMIDDVHEFYFRHYLKHFKSDGFRLALATIPFNFIWDDHDIFDGYGSYPDYLQNSKVFDGVFEAALRFYLLFQHHTNVDLYKLEEIGDCSQTTLLAYGPFMAVLSIDVRSERALEHVVPQRSWNQIWAALDCLSISCQHLVVNATIPLCYPRISGELMFGMAANVVKSTHSIVEDLQKLVVQKKPAANSQDSLDYNTWADAFAKSGAFKQIVNKFGEPELLDDLNDHWTAPVHEQERREFLMRIQQFSLSKSIRVSFVSGDVHLGGAGYFFTDYGIVYPDHDHRLMYQLICSAVGNVPPPGIIVKKLHMGAKRIMFDDKTVEKMYQIFHTDLNDKPLGDRYLMGKRNWLSITCKDGSNLVFDLRMEKEQGNLQGETKSYFVNVPPLRLNEQ